MARTRRPIDLDALVDRAETLVRSHGAVPRGEMKAFRPHLGELGPRLVARGLEVGSTIRVPLATQLVGLATEGAFLAKGVERRVSGATPREVKVSLDALVGEQRLVAVVRDSGVGFASASSPVLDESEVRVMLANVTKLVKLLKAASRAKRRVLREDTQHLTTAGLPSAAPSPQRAPRADDAPAGKSEDLVQEIARRVRAGAAPTHVPALLRSMGLTAENGRRLLLEGAARGLFDLEPESGMARLSREDADWCPPGPMGTRLSWIRARVRQGAHS